MANFGTGYVNIVPKFPGFKAAVEAELGKVNPKQQGQKFGDQFSTGATGGLVKSGAIVGAFATITNQAMSSVANHVGAAISRFDTLNNYPKVMQSLGYSAEDAEASISKMSDRLQNLPTTLDSMVSLTQGLVTMTGDLGKATDAGLALNDMLVASGSNQQLVTSAMEQFRQMLSKGKPEMEDWRSLTTAMPGQMDQLAKAMLGPTANANDLYAALGGGNNEATISMDELLDEMIRLDTEGGESFASFQEQAETAAGGVNTSIANMGNAVTKGITGIMDEIGSDNISGVFNDLKGGINDVFGLLQSGVGAAVPVVKDIYETAKPLVPTIAAVGAAFVGLNKAAPVVMGLAGNAKNLLEAFKLAKGGAGTFAESIAAVGLKINPVGIGLGIAATAIGLIATEMISAKERADNFATATQGLSDVVSDTTNLDNYVTSISDIANTSDASKQSIDDMYASMAGHVEDMQQVAEEAQNEIGQLNAAKAVIDQYAGSTDLSAQAQGQLEWALQEVNEQFGLSITAADVASNSYKDQDGNVVNLKDSIDALIESKKQEIKMDAMKEQLSSAYAAQTDAANAYIAKRDEVNQKEQEYIDTLMRTQGMTEEQARATVEASCSYAEWSKELEGSKDAYDNANEQVENLETNLGDTAKAASDAADEFDEWGNSVSSAFEQSLADKGGLAGLKEDLRSLGADTTDLSNLTEEELLQISDCYDGTASSIVGKLQELGVSMGEDAQKAAEMAASINDTFNSMGATEGLEQAGINVSDFSQKLADAGVSTDQLKAIGTENLNSLAAACQGNMGLMAWAVSNYNNTPIIDKNGNVDVNDASLIDSQGNVCVWNGTKFVNKDTNAEVDDRTLYDAQGRVYTWNRTKLNSKSATVSITQVLKKVGNAAGGVISSAFNNVFSAWGNASGGVIRKHADGFIATGPTMIGPQDVIGEAGAEAYVNAGGHDYIVPLTNRRYSQPFIDLLAEGVNDQTKTEEQTKALISAINLLHSDLICIAQLIPQLSDEDIDRRIWKGVDRRARA